MTNVYTSYLDAMCYLSTVLKSLANVFHSDAYTTTFIVHVTLFLKRLVL